jgi:RHS repeat-associated protein
LPATLDAVPAPSYASFDAATDVARSYVGARYYASRTGRFTTVDPVLPIEDALLDPQRWNRYTYVMNRPGVLTDPDGRCPACCMFLQRIASSPAAQRAQQVIANQGARVWVALTRSLNTPAGQEAIETAAEVLIGGDLGPTAGAGRQGIGAVIGHYDAGYAKVGRDHL